MTSADRWFAVAAVAVAGCASQGVFLPEDTLMLGEVMSVVTPAQLAGTAADAEGERLKNLAGQRFSAEQIAAGRVVVVREGVYWNNTVSGIRRDMLRTVLAPEGLVVEPGNVVEGAVVGEDRPYTTIRRVRATSLEAGGCDFMPLPTSELKELMGGISLVGPSGAATLYCKGIEHEGWQRPRTYWHKPAGAAATTAPRVAPMPSDQPVAAGPPDANADPQLAQLIVTRNRTMAAVVFDLPVWIDGAKVAVLGSGECVQVLLAPGDHVVTAGVAAPSDLWGLSKLELKLSVRPTDRVVAEYVVDGSRTMSISTIGFFSPERWRPELYRFTPRPATDRDTCPAGALPPVPRSSPAAPQARP